MQLTGYVLHKRAYRETSLLVDFFSLEQGRVSAVAKGARGNTKSDRKSLLQAFQKLDFALSGRSNLKNVGSVESVGIPVKLEKTALYCAFYINEILSRALPEAEPIVELFGIYENSLQHLSTLQLATNNECQVASFEPVLRKFEFSLLHALGYLPDFAYDCASGDAIVDTDFYKYDPQNGFERCQSDYKYALSGSCLLSIAKNEYKYENAKQVRKAAKYISRIALIEIIGDKPIKSRELFR